MRHRSITSPLQVSNLHEPDSSPLHLSESQRDRAPSSWLIPQMPRAARAGPGSQGWTRISRVGGSSSGTRAVAGCLPGQLESGAEARATRRVLRCRAWLS